MHIPTRIMPKKGVLLYNPIRIAGRFSPLFVARPTFLHNLTRTMYNPTRIIHNQNFIMHNLVMFARHTWCIIHFLHIQTHTLCIIQYYVKCVRQIYKDRARPGWGRRWARASTSRLALRARSTQISGIEKRCCKPPDTSIVSIMRVESRGREVLWHGNCGNIILHNPILDHRRGQDTLYINQDYV